MAKSIPVIDFIDVGRPATEDRGSLAKSTLRAAVLLCVLLVLASQAQADMITLTASDAFFLDGTNMSIGSHLTGTVTINTSSGDATAWNLSIMGPAESLQFDGAVSTTSLSSQVWLSGLDTSRDFELNLFIQVDTLSGFTGDQLILAGKHNTPFADNYSFYYPSGGEGTHEVLNTGELITPGIATPEPSTITLLASGCLTAGGLYFVRRRRRGAESTPVPSADESSQSRSIH
jgi:hypothetical protein